MYRFTNITGRTTLTGKPATTVLVINNNAVRPEEQRNFSVPTSDILSAMEAGSILVEKDRQGSWVPVRGIDDFEGFSIRRKEQELRLQTIDGHRTSKVVTFEVFAGDAPPPPPAAETPPPEVTGEIESAPGTIEWSEDSITVEGAVITDETAEDVEEVAEESTEEDAEAEGVEEEATEVVTSDSMSAKEAAAHIEATPAEELEGFLSESESRKSVLAAWEAKFAN